MDDAVWTKIAKGLTDNTLRELHDAIRRLVDDGETHNDIARQGRIFEREFDARDQSYDPIPFP